MLNNVLLWFSILPLAANYSISQLLLNRETGYIAHVLLQYEDGGKIILALSFLVMITVLLLNIWGMGCTLVVGKRLVKNPAGRSRSSFPAVRSQGAQFIIPLLLTGILRSIATMLWGLLFIIPGIIYAVRTSLYAPVIACESMEYRGALTRSKQIVRGKTWTVFLYLLGLTFSIYIPVFFLQTMIAALPVADARLETAAHILTGSIASLAQLIMILSTILLYKHIQDSL
ncbi:MAG: hypothetical protein WCX29_01515 [Candidatus Peribacteraceae bacterium]|nr:hypothetical protein [Candidatus Peribacteria bacterium]